KRFHRLGGQIWHPRRRTGSSSPKTPILPAFIENFGQYQRSSRRWAIPHLESLQRMTSLRFLSTLAKRNERFVHSLPPRKSAMHEAYFGSLRRNSGNMLAR